jgi:cell division protein FtsA
MGGKMGRKGRMVVGLDIGTTKVCAIVGEVTEEGVEIIGIGSSPSEGLRKGVVVNIDNTMESIKKAVEEAESVADMSIKRVYAGVSGSHIKSFNNQGMVVIRGNVVEEGDVQRVIEAAKAIPLPADREVLHILPQNYVVDDQDGIKDPIGMSGVRLEVNVHIVTGAAASVQNVVRSVNGVGLDVNEVILEQFAASEAVLSADEKELGVALVDIGGGTTDIAVYAEGVVKYTAVLPVGGGYLTNDIAVGLRTPMSEAEKVKIKYGCACTPMIPQDEMIEVPSVGGREPRRVSRQVLGGIIEPRMDEILNLVCREIVKSGFEDRLAAGIVLTGGTAILEGITELAEHIFNMPVRRGYPIGVTGPEEMNSPLYATAVGLILYGSRQYSRNGRSEGSRIRGVMRRGKKWFSDFF